MQYVLVHARAGYALICCLTYGNPPRPALPALPPSLPQVQSKRVGELGPAGPPDQLRLLLSNVQLVASIFYSLNSPGLTDVSQD